LVVAGGALATGGATVVVCGGTVVVGAALVVGSTVDVVVVGAASGFSFADAVDEQAASAPTATNADSPTTIFCIPTRHPLHADRRHNRRRCWSSELTAI
jgi:hypothetical protein